MFMQYALEFVNLSENGVLCTVSKEFREAAEGDALWREAYETRFSKKEEEKGDALQGGPDSGGGCADGHVVGAAGPLTSGEEEAVDGGKGSFKHLYKARLEDPHVSSGVLWRLNGGRDTSTSCIIELFL